MKTELLSVCLLLFLVAPAQDSICVGNPVFLNGLATYDFPNGYGLSIGASIPFRSIIKQEIHNHLQIGKLQNDKFVSVSLAACRYPFAYSGIFAIVGVGIRYIRPNHFSELSLNQGVLRTLYDGKVYESDENGNIKERGSFGRTYLTTAFSYSQNWSLTYRNPNEFSVQLKPLLWMQYPYNSFLKLHLSLQAGISYRVKNIAVHTRTKYKHLS